MSPPTASPSAGPSWPLLLASWATIAAGASLAHVPIYGLLTLVLVPVGVVALDATLALAPRPASPPPPGARVLGLGVVVVGTALAAVVAVKFVLLGSVLLLARDRAARFGVSDPLPPQEWLGPLGLALLAGVLVLGGQRLRAGSSAARQWQVALLIGLTPVGALGALAVVSRFLPLTA